MASVPVTVYVPAARPGFEAVVRPFDHINPTAPVPPIEDAVAEPVELPKQSTLVCEPILTFNTAAGCEIVTLAIEPVYPAPFSSITKPLTVEVFVYKAEPVLYVVGKYVFDINPFAPKSITEFEIFAKPPFAVLKP